MKDRVKQVMESMHMTQQVFAQFIEMSPASLSSIFNGRTRPTLNIVEAIKKKIPNINTDWLMFGSGSMYVNGSPGGNGGTNAGSPVSNGGGSSEEVAGHYPADVGEPTLDFGAPDAEPTPSAPPVSRQRDGGWNVRPEIIREEIKYIDKPQRKITEIRIYFDDLTYETFVPAKGK